ncbi:MAG: glycosyltransferase [Actinomycetota bacterium]|nr:glycosyltransferase [Actinomycetota bacterium]
MRVAVIGSSRFPIRQPFAGGLEAHTWSLVRGLRGRGHEVTMFAGDGADPSLGAEVMRPHWPRLSAAARRDVSMPDHASMEDHHAYLQLILELSTRRSGDFDVVHNNCLHHLPLALASLLPIPMIMTLHTPPTPWLESAIQAGPCPATFVAVSAHTAKAWGHVLRAGVIYNGVDLNTWSPGPGGQEYVWSGRFTAEKGADLAIDACRLAGVGLRLIGPVSDRDHFAEQIVPRLGGNIRYLGHLDHVDMVNVLGRSAAALVTPRWDEPYGLVAAEALACGTPVIAFDRGGLSEVIDPSCGILVTPGDVPALSRAALAAPGLSRAAARCRAESACSQERMVDEYVELYHRASDAAAA